MTLPGIDKATENLIAWSERDPWAARHAEVFAFHMAPFADILEEPAEDIVELLGEAFHVLGVFVCEDFFTAHFGEDADENVIDEYLTPDGAVTAEDAALDLEPSGRRIDLELVYARPLAGGEAHLAATAARDAGHVRGKNEAALLARYRLAF